MKLIIAAGIFGLIIACPLFAQLKSSTATLRFRQKSAEKAILTSG
jgi:hypothetical protein